MSLNVEQAQRETQRKTIKKELPAITPSQQAANGLQPIYLYSCLSFTTPYPPSPWQMHSLTIKIE